MIIAQIVGGLGNQMFRYAMARRLAHVHKTTLKLDINPFVSYSLRKFVLDKFNISAQIATKEDVSKFIRTGDNIFSKLFLAIIPSYQFKKNYYPEQYYHFDPDVLDLPNDTYVSGYWQSERYFKDIEEIIRAELTLKNPNVLDKRIIKEIQYSNSVGLHIRLGDYLNDKKTNLYHGFYGIEYIKKALKIIALKNRSLKLFIFSDNINWVMQNLNISFQTIFVSDVYTKKDYEDLILMSYCRHNIIVNSTFGWWGAWLNKNKNKIIVVPKRWFLSSPVDTQDLLPNSWIKI